MHAPPSLVIFHVKKQCNGMSLQCIAISVKMHNGDLFIAMIVLVFTINGLDFTVYANMHGLS